MDNSSELISEGEDESHGAHLRDQYEGTYWTHVNTLESDNKDTMSRMNDQPFDIKRRRTEMEECCFQH